MVPSSHGEETRRQADFESRRSSPLSFDHCSLRPNMFRDSLVSPTGKSQIPWTRGIEERSPMMGQPGQARLFHSAMNQARNVQKLGFPSNWEGGNAGGQGSEGVAFAGSHHFNGLGSSGESDDLTHLNADSFQVWFLDFHEWESALQMVFLMRHSPREVVVLKKCFRTRDFWTSVQAFKLA